MGTLFISKNQSRIFNSSSSSVALSLQFLDKSQGKWLNNFNSCGTITITPSQKSYRIYFPPRSSHTSVNVIFFQNYKLLFKNAFTAGNSCFAKPDRLEEIYWSNPRIFENYLILILANHALMLVIKKFKTLHKVILSIAI